MNKKVLIATGLILGISSNTVFAENRKLPEEKRTDIFGQARENSLGLPSASVNVLINTKNLIENVKNSRKKPKAAIIPEKFPTTPKSDPNKPKSGNYKPKSNRPEDSVTVKLNRKNKKGKTNPNKFSENELLMSNPSKIGEGNKRNLSKKNVKLYGVIYNARNLKDLTPKQRAEIKKLHKRMLRTGVAQNVLDTIMIGEDGSLLIPVGKGVNKGKKFRDFMNNKLNTKTHPAYQFPKEFYHNGAPCFFHNKKLNRHSTAAGYYQITKSNFDEMVKYLGIKDFSKESQQIMALELMRISITKRVQGNYKGRGYVELLKNNRKNAIIYGTDPWASSPYSQWSDKNTARNYLGISQQVAKKTDKKNSKGLKDQKYFQSWIDEVEMKDHS